MPFLETAGRVASSWAKFGVAVAGLGWFGLEALDRVFPRPALKTSTTSMPRVVDSDVVPSSNVHEPRLFIETRETLPENRTPLSAVSDELWSNVSGIGRRRPLQLLVSLVVGLVSGLVSRPGLDRFVKWRRVQAAKRRVRLLERDQLLLATVAAPPPVATPATEVTATSSVPMPHPARDFPNQFPAV